MKENKRAQTLWGSKTVAVIVIILLIGVSILFIARLPIINFFKNMFGFATEEPVNYVDRCPVKVALVSNKGEISFCDNSECKAPVKSVLLAVDNEIKVYVSRWWNSNIRIGQIIRNQLFVFDAEIINHLGPLYTQVAPAIYPISNQIEQLNGAYRHSKTEVCRDSAVKIETPVNMNRIGFVSSVKEWALLKLHFGKDVTKIFVDSSAYKYVGSEGATEIYIESGSIIVGKERIGEVKERIITIFPYYTNSAILDKNNPGYDKDLSSIKNGWFLSQLNGAQIIKGEIWKTAI